MSTLKEFEVSLVRTDPRAGSSSGFHVVVQAPDQTAAKRGAEGQHPGYKATNVRPA